MVWPPSNNNNTASGLRPHHGGTEQVSIGRGGQSWPKGLDFWVEVDRKIAKMKKKSDAVEPPTAMPSDHKF